MRAVEGEAESGCRVCVAGGCSERRCVGGGVVGGVGKEDLGRVAVLVFIVEERGYEK